MWPAPSTISSPARRAPSSSASTGSSAPSRCIIGPSGATSGRPTNRTGRSTAAPIASAANNGAIANRRALTTISAPARLGTCSTPPTDVAHRRWLSDRTRFTKALSRPQSSTSLVVQLRRCCTVSVATRCGLRADVAGRHRDHVGETLRGVAHHATSWTAGVWTTLGHLYSCSITSLVVVRGAKPITSRARALSARRPRCSISCT